MKDFQKGFIALLFLIIILLVGGLYLLTKEQAGIGMTDTELRNFVEVALKPGSDKKTIEAFFETQGWPYGFNQFALRYESRYDEGAVEKWYMKSGVGVRVYIDKNDKLVRIEVIRSATGLIL